MTKKIVAIFASVLLLVGSALPVFAEGGIVEGNGSDSTNNVTTNIVTTTQVSQQNSSAIVNNITTTSNSGNNQADHNTSGNVMVATGDAKTQITVSNTANTNIADVDNCNCGITGGDTNISGNGANSLNTANTTVQNTVTLGQTNVAIVDNDVKASSNTGSNNTDYNTGGNVVVGTGNALTKVDLTTNVGQNLAQVGGETLGTSNLGSSVAITGNGSGSRNTANLGLTDWVVLGQTNSSDVLNSVIASSNSGVNMADYNTAGTLGSLVTIITGNAETDVTTDTAANFNQAVIGCDCLIGNVTTKISGNGASIGELRTLNTISANVTNGQQLGQVNFGTGVMNNIAGNSSTGTNDAILDTGSVLDPSIMTGNSWSSTSIENQGNTNIFANSDVSLIFSLQDLLLALGIH